MNSVKVFPTKCAICDTYYNTTVVCPEQLGIEKINADTYSARRFESKINHFRFVRCIACGLLRSDPILPAENIEQLYRDSKFTYEKHVANLTKTYGYYIRKASKLLANKKTFLEIGCGNGFILEEAKKQGFREVWGIEPSDHAIAEASPEIRAQIKVDICKEGLFTENSFDMITIFQTLDHLTDPSHILSLCYTWLKSGGVILIFNHNERSIPARILGEKCPIIDIEHTYLYNKKTITKLLSKNLFQNITADTAWNVHTMSYLTSLVPLWPRTFKQILQWFLATSNLGRRSLWLPIGNLVAIAQK